MIIFGAGGAARAVAVEMALAGAARISVVNRDRPRGEELARLLNDKTPATATWIPWTKQFRVPGEAHIVKVIDCTGQTIMPALISDHSHLGVVKDGKISSENYTAENIEAALRQYEAYGATTVLSLGVNKDLLYGWQARQRAGEFGGAEVFTADRGLGVQRAAPPIPVGEDQIAVQKLLRKLAPSSGKLAARHPDIIKIWVDDFFGTTEPKAISYQWSSIMGYVTTKDGVEIFYKDWGPKSAQPIAFHHGWPLSSDDWDAQMLFFVSKGYRVVAHDRRGHGRSTQVSDGHDMDHYAADAAVVADHLDLRNAIHIGHSTGGGEVARYVARHGKGRVAKAVLVSSVPPLMVKTESNPGGTPIEVFDDFRSALAANRAQFYIDLAAGPFYGFNRKGAKVSQGVINNWWRQGMIGSAKAHYEGIKAFSETDQTEDLKMIDVPTLVMQGDDDQIVPIDDASRLSVKLLKHGTLKVYPGYPHGMLTTHADVINADLLAFVKS